MPALHVRNQADLTELDLIVERERAWMLNREDYKICFRCKFGTFGEYCPTGCVDENNKPLNITPDELLDMLKAKAEAGENYDLDVMFPKRPKYDAPGEEWSPVKNTD